MFLLSFQVSEHVDKVSFDTSMGMSLSAMNKGESVSEKVEDDTLMTFSNITSVLFYLVASVLIVWIFVRTCDTDSPIIGSFFDDDHNPNA